MNMPRYQMVIVWSDKDNCYLVHLPDFSEQIYRAQGKSYAEAAENGADVLQRLDRDRSANGAPLDEANLGTTTEAATIPPVEPAFRSTVSLAGEEIAPRTPAQKTPPFPALKTTLVSIGTSVVAVAMLAGLVFISEGFTFPKKETSTTPPIPASAASQEFPTATKNNSTSKANDDSQPKRIDSKTSTAAASPLMLATSIAESGVVWAIATYSDKTSTIISGTETGLITIRDQKSGQLIRTIQAHDDKVRSIAIAPNARQFISGSGDSIKAWNLQTGELLYELPSSTSVWSIAISPDESQFISGASDGTLAAWELETGKPIYSTNNGAGIWSVAISPDGKSFVSGDSNRATRQWDLAEGQPMRTFAGHQSNVRAVAISPDGKTLASGSWDKTIKLWSLETGELLTTLEGHRDRVVSVAISSDSSTLASGSIDNTAKLWSLSEYKLIESLEAHSDWVLATAFEDKEQALITGGKDKTIKIWE